MEEDLKGPFMHYYRHEVPPLNHELTTGIRHIVLNYLPLIIMQAPVYYIEYILYSKWVLDSDDQRKII